jgi:hypothetical protein
MQNRFQPERRVEWVFNQLKSFPILAEAIETAELRIVGARYDVEPGVVEMTVR